MKKAYTINLPPTLLNGLEGVPMSRSAAITQSILNADRNAELLVQAFRLRLSMPTENNETKVSYTRDTKLDTPLKKLIEMTKLPGEQVIRLCVEAYIYRL